MATKLNVVTRAILVTDTGALMVLHQACLSKALTCLDANGLPVVVAKEDGWCTLRSLLCHLVHQANSSLQQRVSVTDY